MKKILVFLVMTMTLMGTATHAQDFEKKVDPYVLKKEMKTDAFKFAGFYKSTFNENNEVKRMHGIDIGYLGYTSKHYFNPITVGEWNSYWHWGTIMFVFPNIGFGTEKYLDNGWFVGIKTFYILPIMIELGFRI
jgi:hypothetical protein